MRFASILLCLAMMDALPCSTHAQGAADDTRIENVVIKVERNLVPERRPATKVAFPKIKNFKTLRITLQREGCIFGCSAYSVEIDGDGTVLFDGADHVAIHGHHRSRVSDRAVRDLFAEFRKADFFWLFDSYAPPGVRNPDAVIIGIEFDGGKKKVRDFDGSMGGIPIIAAALESRIDEIAETAKWVRGDTESFARLKAEGWDFHARDDGHTLLLGSAAQSRNVALLKQLLDAGVPIETRGGCEALADAVLNEDVEAVRMLVEARAPAYWTGEDGKDPCSALGVAALLEEPDIAREILKLHPDANLRGFYGFTPLMEASVGSNGPLKNEDALEIINLLAKAGADPNARDTHGDTALMLASGEPDVIRVLVRMGAAVNWQNLSGQTALMSSINPEGTKVLLEAGADPYLKDREGKTALDLAEDWRKTAPVLRRWMAAHPQKLPN